MSPNFWFWRFLRREFELFPWASLHRVPFILTKSELFTWLIFPKDAFTVFDKNCLFWTLFFELLSILNFGKVAATKSDTWSAVLANVRVPPQSRAGSARPKSWKKWSSSGRTHLENKVWEIKSVGAVSVRLSVNRSERQKHLSDFKVWKHYCISLRKFWFKT